MSRRLRERARPACPVAISSSAKNGLPPDRARTVSTELAGDCFAGEDARELGGELVDPERAELEIVDLIQALELGKQRKEGMAPVELVGPIGRDHDQAGTARVARQEADEVAAPRIGPVDVLEDEDERALVSETAEELEHDLEEARLVGGRGQRPLTRGASLGRGKVRQEVRELDAAGAKELVEPIGRQGTEQWTQGADDGRVGEPGRAHLHRAADEDAGAALAGAAGELGDQPGLADAGLAGDQHERWLAGAGSVEGSGEAIELRRTPDEDRARDAGHGVDHRTTAPRSPGMAVGLDDRFPPARPPPPRSPGIWLPDPGPRAQRRLKERAAHLENLYFSAPTRSDQVPDSHDSE